MSQRKQSRTEMQITSRNEKKKQLEIAQHIFKKKIKEKKIQYEIQQRNRRKFNEGEKR